MKKMILVLISVLAVLFVLACSSGSGDTSKDDSDNTSSGPKCGNGIIEEGEICDGNVPCWQAGHFYPELFAECNSDCSAYNTSKCQKRDPEDLCGNFVKDNRETCEQGETTPCVGLPGNYVTGDAACNRYCTGWDPTNCSAGGNKTCAQLFTCVDNCADDAACKETCTSAASDQGLELYNALHACWSTSCASGADKNECMKQQCPSEYYSCYPSEKCGNGVIDDGEVCEKKDTKPCQEMGDSWQPINEAVCSSTCTSWDTYACVDKDALTCFQVYECVEKCTDSECKEECIGKTWAAAKNKYDTMMECLGEKCKDAPVMDACMAEECKFQSDACKTHLTCGNGNIDMYEICEKGDSVDCGTLKDKQGEAIYEAETANAFCNTNCTEHITLMCFKFCSCSEVKACVEKDCGGYSNSADTDCIETCESWGNKVGKGEASGWRGFIQNCYETDQGGNPTGVSGFDSQTCVDEANKNYDCGTSDHAKCPY